MKIQKSLSRFYVNTDVNEVLIGLLSIYINLIMTVIK